MAHDVVGILVGPYPRSKREVASPEFKRRAVGHFDIRSPTIEGATIEVNSVIDSMIVVAGVVSAVSLKWPVADKPFRAEVRMRARFTSVPGVITQCCVFSSPLVWPGRLPSIERVTAEAAH